MQGVNRAFKVTCAVFKRENFQYHATYKKALGEYYELEMSYWAGQVIFVYKRTFHSSEGLSASSNKMLKRLKNLKPEAIVTLMH